MVLGDRPVNEKCHGVSRREKGILTGPMGIPLPPLRMSSRSSNIATCLSEMVAVDIEDSVSWDWKASGVASSEPLGGKMGTTRGRGTRGGSIVEGLWRTASLISET